MKKPNAKQQAFIQEYLKCYDAKAAAIKAGYSAKTAEQIGYQLLQNPSVAIAIERGQARTAARTDVTIDRIIEEYARIAFAKVSDFASWSDDGVKLVDSSELTPEQIAAVAEVSEQFDKYGNKTVGFKLHGKLPALNALGKHLGMFSEKLDEKIQDAIQEVLGDIEHRLPPEVYAQVVNAIRGAMGLPPMGAGGESEDSGQAVH